MKINILDRVKVENALAAVNGNHQVRNMRYADVMYAASAAQQQLDRLLPKKQQSGASYTWFHSNLPKAYKWQTSSTCIRVVRYPSGWFLADVERITIYPGETFCGELMLPEEKAETVIRKLLKDNNLKHIKGFGMFTA